MTRKQFEEIFEGKEEIQAEDLVYVLEERLGYSVSLEKKSHLTEAQKKRMTDWIFSNEEILKQLRESELERDEDYIYTEEESERLIREARDEK